MNEIVDSEAMQAWKRFCDQEGYELNDLKSRKAFGMGVLVGCVIGARTAEDAVETLLRGIEYERARGD